MSHHLPTGRFIAWRPAIGKEIDVNSSHMSALKQKHAALESKLAAEENRPFPDDALILRLKKEKLALKDEMAGDSQPA